MACCPAGLGVLHQQQLQEPDGQDSQLQEPYQDQLPRLEQSHGLIEAQGLDVPAAAVTGDAADEQVWETDQLQDATASEEEVALLLSAVVSGLQKELQWMVSMPATKTPKPYACNRTNPKAMHSIATPAC